MENIIYNIGLLLILFFLIKVIIIGPILRYLHKKNIADKYTLNIEYVHEKDGKMEIWHDNPKELGSGWIARLDLTKKDIKIKSIYFNVVKK